MERLHLTATISSEMLTQERREIISNRLSEFCELLKKKPFENFYGFRGLSAFTFYSYMKDINPDFIVEVGVWKGFSTWIIANACPNASILCLDPITNFQDPRVLNTDFIGHIFRTSSAKYLTEDFSCVDFKRYFDVTSKSLVFFDDHNSKFPRLQQAHNAGFQHVIFDDNWPWRMTHDTFESDQDTKRRAVRDCQIEHYELLPPLWDVILKKANGDIHIQGAGFPFDTRWKEIYENRDDYSFVTYIRLGRK